MAPAQFRPIGFGDLSGWAEDDHAAALAALAAHGPVPPSSQSHRGGGPRGGGGWPSAAAKHPLHHGYRHGPPPPYAGAEEEPIRRAALLRLAQEAAALAPNADAALAREFFETRFWPVLVVPEAGRGLLTGYFEPEVWGSRTRTERFQAPLLAPPPDLVEIDPENRPPDLDPALSHARRLPDGRLVPCFDRAEIEAGALSGRNLECAWIASPVDAFFIHVQGSARVRLETGEVLRLAYAAKSGHPYTSIGRRLVERGLARPEEMNADRLRAWLEENPAAARDLMRENRSYIFFAEQTGLDPALGARAAAGVQIRPGRSLAVDPRVHAFGTPVWIEADLPAEDWGPRLGRLFVADDKGSAIVGPARGDIFVGVGVAAGSVAGRIRHAPEKFVVLLPNGV